MKTIEQVRLANLKRLVDRVQSEDGAGVPDAHIAGRLGITGAYLSLINSGKRKNIDSDAARKIERKLGLSAGWMDTDFDLWPFPDASLLANIERLTRDQRIEVQGALRDKLAQFGVAPAAGVVIALPPAPAPKDVKPSRNVAREYPSKPKPVSAKKSRKKPL